MRRRAADADELQLSDPLGTRNAVQRRQQQQQHHLTRLMRLLCQHRGMAAALEACPDMLRQIATFIRRVGEHLFTATQRLLKYGKPPGGLLDSVDPPVIAPVTSRTPSS